MSKHLRALAQAVAVATATTGAAVALATPAAAAAPAPDTSVANFEIDFLSTTVQHHNLAIRMGELCLEKATGDDRLPSLCADVVKTQTAEREQLQKWLVDWYGVTPPSDTALPANGPATLSRLASKSGEQFDAEMARTFVQHHAMFLPKADKCRDTADHAALANLCHEMYDAQRAEIPRFRAVVAESTADRDGGGRATSGGRHHHHHHR